MELSFARTMNFHFVANHSFEQMVLKVTTDATDVVAKLFAAVRDGKIDHGPFQITDGDCAVDDDGVSWVNAETWIDGHWVGIGADDADGAIYLTVGLKTDGLDYTAPLITDPEAYWMDFIAPLRKLYAIIR